VSHQCVHCGEVYPIASKELIEGCSKCRGHFFFYVREDQLEKVKENPIEVPKEEMKRIESDIREIAGITDEDAPVILDLESIRITGDGKYELDVVNLFSRKPVVYKLEEGKYIIDLTTTLKIDRPKTDDR
jgi:predicted  nucleic acid-binding Zn-ribbon protein